MRWPASLLIGVITGLATMVAAFAAADLSVGWYRISSFEGASGYFVISMALIGLIAGALIGLIASRVVAKRPRPGFAKALGLALTPPLAIVAIIGASARMLADVPPEIDGQALLLSVEIRWPEGRTPPPNDEHGEWSLRLSSSVGRTVRASETGPLWREDAREEDGRWVVPGAVEIFTSRGARILDVQPDGLVETGFMVPLPARPGPDQLQWSDWMPHAAPGEPALPDGFRYRFRVVPRDQPVRTERVGPFEISTVAAGFTQQTNADRTQTTWAADAHFLIAQSGQPVAFGNGRVDAVAVVGGAAPALLIQVADETGSVPAACSFLSMQDDQPLIAPIGECEGRIHASPLTSDSLTFTHARDRVVPPGRVDRASLATPGQYLLGDQVIDTRTLTARAVSASDQSRQIGRIPPLGVSPDGASFIRLEFAEGSDEAHALAVIVPATNERYRLPIDKVRMRYATFDQIDPAWVLHHFTWRRDDAGQDRLIERGSFQPLAWRGTLTHDGSGYREYRVAPVQESLREALIDFLAADLQAERVPVEAGAYAHAVRIQGATVWVSYEARERHVGVWMDRGTDSTLVATIAGRFDAALASGRYDHLFEPLR